MFGKYVAMSGNHDYSAETDGIVVASVTIKDHGPRVTLTGKVGGLERASATAHWWPFDHGVPGRIKTNSMTFPVPQGEQWRVDVDHEFVGNYDVDVWWISW